MALRVAQQMWAKGLLDPNCLRSFWQTHEPRSPSVTLRLSCRDRASPWACAHASARGGSPATSAIASPDAETCLALANVDDHPLAVDVGYPKIEHLLTAEARTIVQSQQRPMLDVHLCIEQGTYFLPVPDCWQLAPHPRLDDLLFEPDLLQGPRVEELQCRAGPLDRSPSQLPFVEQMQKKRPNMLGPELLGRLVEVSCELGNDVSVAANCAFGEVLELEILLHALA